MVTWDPVNISAGLALSNGNLTATNNTTFANRHTRATVSQTTGLYYCEVTIGPCNQDTTTAVGVMNASELFTHYIGQTNNSVGYYDSGSIIINGAGVLNIGTFAQNDVICMATNVASARIWFRKNGGNWNNDILSNQNPAAGVGGFDMSAITGALFPGLEIEDVGEAGTANFGATPYAQVVPSGFINWDGLGYVENAW